MPGGRPLNILAIEPFCGGGRREMVRLIQKHSRHRWDWRTTGPRRMHRRLVAAAGWFAEELERLPPAFEGTTAPPDLLFVSEAIYLNELLRQRPELDRLPRVMYVHDHGERALPLESREYEFAPRPRELETIHLLNAVAATAGRGQAWLATSYHAAAFLMYIDDLFLANRHLFNGDPRPKLEENCRIVAPPVAREAPPEVLPHVAGRRVVVAAEASDGPAVADVFELLMLRGEPFELASIGSLPELADIPHQVIDRRDAAGAERAIAVSRVYLAAGREAWFDPWAVRALRAGNWPIVPGLGIESAYDELIPPRLQAACLHDGTPEGILKLAGRAWSASGPELDKLEVCEAVGPYEPETAVAGMDDRLERLVRG